MPHRFSLLALLFFFLVPAEAQAQATFAVTVAAPTDDNPRPNPWPAVFYIDGEESAELTLVRGETYVFEVGAGAEVHPFYISTDAAGAGAGVWSEGVTGNFATTGETLTFIVPMSAPDLLYYECGAHPNMGWRLNIVNPVANEDEVQPLALDLGTAFPNPFEASTRLGVTLPEARTVTVAVFDAAGRRVRVLHDGPLAAGTTPFELSARGLASGVYTVRAVAGEHTVERRVTLVR